MVILEKFEYFYIIYFYYLFYFEVFLLKYNLIKAFNKLGYYNRNNKYFAYSFLLNNIEYNSLIEPILLFGLL